MGTKVYDNALDLITFSRASGGTALRKISYGSELVTNGTFDTDVSGWTPYLTATVSWESGRIKAVKSGNYGGFLQQLTGLTIGKVYTVSAELEVVNFNQSQLWVSETSGGVGVSTQIISGAGVKTYGFQFVATATSMWINARGDIVTGTGTLYGDNISVKEVLFDQPDGTLTLFNHPNNIPRIEYTADGTVKGLLIEEQRTNLVTYSEDLTQIYWTKTAVTFDANTITETATTDIHRFFSTPATVGAGATVSAQVKLKKNAGHDYAYVGIGDSGGRRAYIIVNLTDGSVTETGVEQAATGAALIGQSVSPLGGGEYLVSVTGSIATAQTTAAIIVGMSNSATPGGLPSYLGNVANSIDATAMQLEVGSFPTSYIKNEGNPSGATRAADIASIPTSAFGYNQKAGTVVVDVNTFDTDYFNWVWLLDGTSDTSLYGHSAANGWRVFGAGGTVAYLGSLPGNADAQIGYAYNNAVSAALLDGGSVITAVYGQPVAVTTLRLGSASASSTFLNGHIKSIQYYPRRLTNTQLQELTA